ncbi:prolipoprotein diacylglyceryl transferase [Iamia sp.]|uniref:prolipoprotein diacylglyceryl transferase n=1 Tax=Iamia sp. TaxID=2722710 RepID=UPI002C87CA83|nr:prolipoprotein diacylglyceryl transferase family protein [Iamia sp.]HXH59399.1 prolipoprotein diacylglyceryl transferase family protein [Iamia sp.]
MTWSAISYPPLVTIDVGPMTVSPHGIFTAVGFLVGSWFFLRDTRRRDIDDEVIISALTRAAVGAIVGARLVYVLNHIDRYGSPLDWVKIWEGGISLLGGLTGGVLTAWWIARRRGLDFVALVDLAAPWLALGIAVGRIGDIVIADHLGPPTSMPFGFRCPDGAVVGQTVGSPCPPGEVVHLTAAYDLLASLAIFAVMLASRGRLRARRGHAALLVAVLYGVNRFSLDFVRADDRRLGLTGSQWTALVAVIIGVALLVWRWRQGPTPRPTDSRRSQPEPNNNDDEAASRG